MWVNVIMVTIKKKLPKQTTECVCVCFTTFFHSSFISQWTITFLQYTVVSASSTISPQETPPPSIPPSLNKYYILSVVSVWSRTARPTRFHRHRRRGRGRWREWGGMQEHWLAAVIWRRSPESNVKWSLWRSVRERAANKDSKHRKQKHKNKKSTKEQK